VARVLRNHWRWFLTALVLAGLAARLAWIAAHTETGWETIASDWREATIGQFIGHRLPVAQRYSTEQTDFWLAEIDRLLAREPHTPELLVGAVRMLGTYYGDYHLSLSADLFAAPNLYDYDRQDHRGYDSASEPRQAKQIQLAVQATSEFPMSLLTWQTLAEVASDDEKPSEVPVDLPDWRKVLDECRAHDPDNSMYDFLAADRLLTEDSVLEITDEQRVANGIPTADDILREHRRTEIELENEALEHIERGLKLPKFEAANDNRHAYRFIDLTGLPLPERAHLKASYHSGDFDLGVLSVQLDDLAERMEKRDPAADTTELRRLALRFCQLRATQPNADPAELMGRTSSLAVEWKSWLDYLKRDLSPDAQRSEELAQARRMLIDSSVRGQLWSKVFSGWGRQPNRRFDNTWIDYIAWKAAALSVQLFLGTGIAVSLWQVLRLAISASVVETKARLGILRQLTAWFAALFASVMIFALAPAEIIGHTMQGWGALLFFVIAIMGLPIGIAIALKGRISIWTLLAFTVGYTLLFFWLYLWNLHLFDRPLQQLPPAVWIPPRGVEGYSVDSLLSRLKPTSASNVANANRQRSAFDLRWPALQWVLYHGAEWTIAGALVGIGIWWWLRANRERKRAALAGLASKSKRETLLPGLFRAIARSALGAAAVALAVYLAMVPERIEHFEAIYRFESQQVQNADWAGLQKRFDKLMADEQGVAALRRQVEREFDAPADSQ
jgi:hypothetical protein